PVQVAAPAAPAATPVTSATSSFAPTAAKTDDGPAITIEPVIKVSESPAAPAKPVSAKPSSSGLSIKEMMHLMTAQMETAVETQQSEDAAITDESLSKAWKVVLTSINKPNLAAELSRRSPSYSAEKNEVTQMVSNTAQRDWIIAKCHAQLESELRKATGNKQVKLVIESVPEDLTTVVAKPYTPTEKAEAMREKSEPLRKLEQELELEVS
ncbi:MAG: hypothetical protein HUJ90_07210, partial [Bacteroidales bacterium]|nr:hypothetical protein [Bacteroidales bacterium]